MPDGRSSRTKRRHRGIKLGWDAANKKEIKINTARPEEKKVPKRSFFDSKRKKKEEALKPKKKVRKRIKMGNKKKKENFVG